MRLVERLQQGQPVIAGVGGEDVGVAGVDHGDADVGQCGLAGAGVPPVLHDDRDVAGLHPPAVEHGGLGGQQRSDIGGEVGTDVVAQLGDRDDLGAVAAEALPRYDTQPERVVARRPGQSAAMVVRVDIVDDDAGIAQLCPTQHHLQPIDQRGVAAPVHSEGLLLPRGLCGAQVGDDVAATKGVDRLLRVADEHQRRDTTEGAVDHLPLHRVGVLELIDHHDRPAPAHPRPCRRVSGFQGIGQPAE